MDSSGRGFDLAGSSRPFTPWGFNYDHDERDRLLEDYWLQEWSKVHEDFAEMKRLGANVVRIHLQLGKFLLGRDEVDTRQVLQLQRLVALAEETRLYLDITGLGCYRKSDVPPWYDTLSEEERWRVQARFWGAVASACARSPAVFCYDLMNEPFSPAGSREPGAWLGPAFEGGYHYTQVISLDQAGRPRVDIARRWIQMLSRSIREHDPVHLITVGLVSASLDRPGITSGFLPAEIAPDVDFISLHLYPEGSRMDESRETLRGFAVGKPVVVEEIFPLWCSPAELRRFMETSHSSVAGWMGFYWGRTPEECRLSQEARDKRMLSLLEIFQDGPLRAAVDASATSRERVEKPRQPG